MGVAHWSDEWVGAVVLAYGFLTMTVGRKVWAMYSENTTILVTIGQSQVVPWSIKSKSGWCPCSTPFGKSADMMSRIMTHCSGLIIKTPVRFGTPSSSIDASTMFLKTVNGYESIQISKNWSNCKAQVPESDLKSEKVMVHDRYSMITCNKSRSMKEAETSLWTPFWLTSALKMVLFLHELYSWHARQRKKQVIRVNAIKTRAGGVLFFYQ